MKLRAAFTLFILLTAPICCTASRAGEAATPRPLEDWNVPVINSERLFMALERLGRTAELVVYPGELHGISTPSFIEERWQRYLDWLERYVKGGEGVDSIVHGSRRPAIPPTHLLGP